MNINKEIISSNNDILIMLDDYFQRNDMDWWNNFYKDKAKNIPFFCDGVDKNLYKWIENKNVIPGKVLEIGCGNGRNSIFLSRNGFSVTGIDFSLETINWAKQKTKEKKINNINYFCSSIFDFNIENEMYDFIYDSGCLHHIKPHRRVQYLELITKGLKKNGLFGLVCFNEKGGANISDYDVYKERSMKGGLAFTKEKLVAILTPYFDIEEIKEMENTDNNDEFFGESFLWNLLLRKKEI